ncbi:MAG: flagellar motor switch protein FliG [Granulosicoccus sp.]|nr:flagellar motor switch protein FliG [Granulosicoccus sp.]
MADTPDESDKLPLDGSSQAAILLMALGEEEAASVLQHMKPEEVQAVGEAMNAINGVSQEQIGETLDEFVNRVRDESSLGLESAHYFRSTLTKALGKDKATSVLARLEPSEDDQGLSSLRWIDPRVVAKIIRDEHPQIIATVLSQLSSEQAGAVLDLLPEALRSDLMMRIVNLDKIHPSALADLNEIIQELFESDSSVELSGLGGVSVVAEILNNVSKEAEEQVLIDIEEADSDIVAQIKESMFIFENLLLVTDRDMQTMLRDVTNEDLILALKGASQELQKKIFGNMSSRAAELLKDDLEAKGPVKLSEVETAQRSILTVAKDLSEEGKISLGGKGDDYV